MSRPLGIVALAGFVLGACHGVERPKLSQDQILAQLRALPGVKVDVRTTRLADYDYSYYVLHFTQPVDHDDPSPDRATFQQEVSLLHIDERDPVPMIVHTSGYADYYNDTRVELTKLFGANQVSIEHRYFGSSRPDSPDWTKLTIEQMAADEHDIITALRTVYHGAFLTTGGSKGGMTAVFHRRFYPDDVEGTVAYVAPISFGAPDERYAEFLDTIGSDDCKARVRQVAIELLRNRRAAMESRAQAQADAEPTHSYERLTLGVAVESAIVSFEWTFWQDSGAEQCRSLPADPSTSSDDELFTLLDNISPVTDNDDTKVAFYEPYYYQAYAQLGFPDYGTQYLYEDRHYSDKDFANELPTAEPDYDSEAMRDIDDFVEHDGKRLLFIYGGWDPWTGGKFAIGVADQSRVFTQLYGMHDAQIADLELRERNESLAMLRSWTDAEPMLSRLLLPRRAEPTGRAPDNRLPTLPGYHRAHRAHRAQK
jgi:hypothetical protein